MAFLGQSTFQRRRNYLQNGDPLEGPSYDMSNDTRTGPTYDLSNDYRTGVSVGSGAPAANQRQRQAPANMPFRQTQQTQQPQQQAPAPMQAQQPLMQAPKPIQQPPSFQRTGTLQQRLFDPLTTGSEQGQQNLGEAASFFQQEAGPSRTYEGIGAQNLLTQAFQGGQAGDIEKAKQLVGAQYQGPQGLDQNVVAGLQNLVGQLQTRQQALGTGGGLQTLIQQSVAGLTPGEAKFEAQRRLPEAKVQARDLGYQTVTPLSAQLEAERQKAQKFAEQRTQEEADIAAKSQGFLTGERGKIEQDLAQKIAAAQAQQTQEAQEYQDVLAATPEGRLAALQAANPELASQFNTEARKKDIEADQKFQQVLNDPRFASIAGIDPLGLSITKRGKQFYSSDGQDLRRVVPDKATRALLYERQQELEKLFDPGTVRAFSKTAGPGEYSSYKPLYGGEGFQALDPVNYLGFDPGTRPSRENLSSAEQKSHFNNIQNILDKLDTIGEAEPFRAAQILGQIDNYLEDEAAALEAKGEELSKSQKKWYSQVKKARKKAKKSKSTEWGRVAGVIVGDVLTGGLVNRNEFANAIY